MKSTTNQLGQYLSLIHILALLGDLTKIAYQRETPVAVHHALSSVKIYEAGYETPKEFYGAVIEEAIGKASRCV